MRGPWLALVWILVAHVAYAGHSIVVMTEPAQQGALGGAMQVALTGRGVAVATLAAPSGELRLERAAYAQRAALQLGADAAVWLDEGDVCAVSADGRAFRHAPMPPDLADPARAFGAIATSLLDELIAPPEPAQSVDVDVHVRVGGQEAPFNGFVNPRPEAPPVDPFAPPSAVATFAPPAIPRRDRTQFAVGPMLSPASAGVQGELAFPLSPTLRLAANASGNIGTFRQVFIYSAAVELRGIVSGHHNHFDLGGTAGFATATETSSRASIVYVGASLNYTWEHETSATMLSIVPLVASDGSETVPGAYACLRWVFPL